MRLMFWFYFPKEKMKRQDAIAGLLKKALSKAMTELAAKIGMTVAAVSISVSRGEKMVKNKA